MFTIKIILKVTFCELFLITFLHPQSNDNNKYFYRATFGIQAFPYFSQCINLNYQNRNNLLFLHIQNSEENNLDFSSPGKNPFIKYNELGLLYGKPLIKYERHFISSISFGLAYIEGTFRGKYLNKVDDVSYYEKKKISTIGAISELHIFWLPIKYFGVGCLNHINFNKEKLFYSFFLCVQAGKLR